MLMSQYYCEDKIEITYIKVLGKGSTVCCMYNLLFTSFLINNSKALRMTLMLPQLVPC